MVRSQMNFKRLSLTDIKIEINRVPKKKALIEAMEKAGGLPIDYSCPCLICFFFFLLNLNCSLMADVKNKWENSSWGRRLTVQKRRASLNDFDRFKLMLAKIKVRNSPSCLFEYSLYCVLFMVRHLCFRCWILPFLTFKPKSIAALFGVLAKQYDFFLVSLSQ